MAYCGVSHSSAVRCFGIRWCDWKGHEVFYCSSRCPVEIRNWLGCSIFKMQRLYRPPRPNVFEKFQVATRAETKKNFFWGVFLLCFSPFLICIFRFDITKLGQVFFHELCISFQNQNIMIFSSMYLHRRFFETTYCQPK